MMRNILLVIEYDGTDFHGWQKQPDARTVQGEIEHVLSYISGKDVSIDGTSRTDRGVHALGQCATFSWDCPIPTKKLATVMNRRLGTGGEGRSGAAGDIRIVSATEVPDGFHARFSCKGKTYRYIIDGSRDIFRRNHAYLMSDELDVDAMREAAGYIVGTHDFKSFEASGGTERETTIRTVYALEIEEDSRREDHVSECAGDHDAKTTEIVVTGDGFLYNMVRIISGTLIEVGLGKRRPNDIPDVIDAKDRSMAGFTAPPSGLYLERIYFDAMEMDQCRF